MSRFLCLLLASQALVALSAPTLHHSAKNIAVRNIDTILPAVSDIAVRNKNSNEAESGGAAGEVTKAEPKAAGKAAKATGKAAQEGAAAKPAAGNATAEAPAKVAEPAKAIGGEAGEGAQTDVAGIFGTAVELKGADEKQDVLFTKQATGALEVEFQDVDTNTLTVTENKTPAAAPIGFKFIDPVSYKIELAKGADGLTLQKVDYIFDKTNTAVAALDLPQSRIGKLCADAGSFVISDGLGESEFELEEGEISLTVTNMVGEWGVFIPDAAGAVATPIAAEPAAKEGAAPPAAKEGAAKEGAAPPAAKEGAAKEGAAKEGAAKEGAAPPAAKEGAAKEGATPPAAKEGAAEEEEEAGKPEVFGTAFAIEGGNIKQDFLFPPGAAGALELEFNGTSANKLLATAAAPTGTLPSGFVFVDPQSFTIASESKTVASDIVKIDYIFTEAVNAACDVTQGKIAKLVDGAFVVQGVAADGGEFEFEAEENEWTLTTGNSDFNGEFAVVIPKTALTAESAAKLAAQ